MSAALPPSQDPREALLERAADVALYGGGFDADELALAAKLGINLERECQALELAAAELAALEATRDLAPPPARLESKLSQLSEALHAPKTIPFPATQRKNWIPAVAAGALIGVLGTLAVMIARDARRMQANDPVAFVRSHPNAVHWKWAGTQDDHVVGRVAGEVYFDAASDEGLLEIEGLAPNDPSREQYQLWIFDADRDERYPVDGGVFDISSSGRVLIPVRAHLHVSRPVSFAVTVEPPGGVVVSARRIALLAKP